MANTFDVLILGGGPAGYIAAIRSAQLGKIMRRLLRDVAEGRALGDTTTLADPAVVAGLKDKYEE